MVRARITQEEIKEDGAQFFALRLETRNADLLFLSEEEDQLGTLAVALPPTEKMIGPPVSSILLGERNTIVARMIAERLANKTGKIALTSVFSKKINEREIGQVFLSLLEKTLKKEMESAEGK